MENCSSNRKNNLEKYLRDVYDNECVFKIKEEEVDFIHKGIKTLVLGYIDQLFAHDRIAAVFKNMFREIQRKNNDSLANVYFPSKWASRFQEYVYINVKSIPLLNVGSFSEGTRNGFPDEFDFIFIIAFTKDISAYSIPDFETLEMHLLNEDFAHNLQMSRPIHDGRRNLSFSKFVKLHGPAAKLQFIYNNGQENIIIDADLVTAVQCSAAMNRDRSDYKYYLERCVSLKSFHDKVRDAKTFLLVPGGISFTQTEVDFIGNILSVKHKKVYRILKYLINGHGDGEELEENYRIHGGYSTYKVKIMIMYHHDVCTHADTGDLGPCVLQVLEEMSQYKDASNFPFFRLRNRYLSFFLLPYLKSLIKILKCAQTSKDNYDYETKTTKSVSGQFLHDKDLSERGLPVSEEFLEARELVPNMLNT